jgi:hypothetical protein
VFILWKLQETSWSCFFNILKAFLQVLLDCDIKMKTFSSLFINPCKLGIWISLLTLDCRHVSGCLFAKWMNGLTKDFCYKAIKLSSPQFLPIYDIHNLHNLSMYFRRQIASNPLSLVLSCQTSNNMDFKFNIYVLVKIPFKPN